MSTKRFENLYKALLENEDLHLMFAGMKGTWEEDRDRFIKAQKELENVVNFIDTTDAEYTD